MTEEEKCTKFMWSFGSTFVFKDWSSGKEETIFIPMFAISEVFKVDNENNKICILFYTGEQIVLTVSIPIDELIPTLIENRDKMIKIMKERNILESVKESYEKFIKI